MRAPGLRAPTFPLDRRASGILLHPTSLPGPHGCGDVGRPADAFLDWLKRARQSIWQMLPIGPVGFGNSPYSTHSSFAGNTLLISLERLEEEGWLDPEDPPARLPRGRVDYAATARHRRRRLLRAYARFRNQRRPPDFEDFLERERSWLDDFALYSAIKDHHRGQAWVRWPEELRRRDPAALGAFRRAEPEAIEFHAFCQWIFDRQWEDLRTRCADAGVTLVGDLPIFLAHDSADVWAHPELFFLDGDGMPTVVAGVPPDYFSRTGQRWGNPLYRWDVLQQTGFSFWVERMRHALRRFDLLRLDHFIGFVRYWEIPATAETAADGIWRPVPGYELFDTLRRALGVSRLPFIAEDLGEVSEDVFALRDAYELPGIRVLQFAFGDDPQADSFKPHNYVQRAVVYTGTHDNDTLLGWLRDPGGEGRPRTPEQAERERSFALRYLGTTPGRFVWDAIRATLMSVANFTIFPLQDVLELGSAARMNRPGTLAGNWEWRTRDLPPERAERLAELTELYDRTEDRR
ncbi:MAG: 4-alpha-glucanotransferase [Pseudomonadota bacterium]|nr:MAG: 4-alpha-glucanotransferase [Pseudomonadota bacterium]